MGGVRRFPAGAVPGRPAGGAAALPVATNMAARCGEQGVTGVACPADGLMVPLRSGCNRGAGPRFAGVARFASLLASVSLLASISLLASAALAQEAGAPATGPATGAAAGPATGAATPEAGGQTVQPVLTDPVVQQPFAPEQSMQPSVQPSIQEPVPDGMAPEAATPTPAAAAQPSSSLAPGLPPASTFQPVPQSAEDQVLLSSPRVTDPEAAGVIQADPARIFGFDAPDLTGFAVSAITGLQYGISLRTQYSDNVWRRGSDSTLPAGYRSRSDWRFSPTLTAAAGRPLGRQLLFLNATVGRDYYARNTRLDKSRLSFNGGLQWLLGTRCGGRLQGDYSQRETRYELFDEFIPSTQKRTGITAGGTCRLFGRLSGNLSYDWYKTANDNESRKIADVRGHGFTGGVSYPISTRGSLSATGFWRTADYPNQILFTGEKNHIAFSGFSVGAGYRIGPMMSVNGSIGRTWINYRNPLFTDSGGSTWALGFNYAGPKLGVNVSTGRSSAAGGGSSNFSISKHYTGTLTYSLGRINTSAGYSRRESDNRGTTFVGGVPLGRYARRTDSWMLGADTRLGRFLSVSADYRYEKRPARVDFPGYSANIASLSLGANF